ncbi:sigma-70 family RNA polymerase sigma factor [uncultured Merdimonas sp.]|uniref:sigma-70 family RNA polymerase sigma factor n=1 Tax=uncultured Merdimonas sp. TaxID=2023269 RepID=UPI003209C7B2
MMDNEQLVARIQSGENEAENMLQLWKQNKGFIATIARKYSAVVEMEDLEQEGYIGLCEAVRRYEPDKGTPFINYAAFWIRQAMRRYVDNCGAVVRLPSNMVDWIRAYKRAAGQYKQAYGEWPSDAAMCWLLDISHKKLREIRQAARMGDIGSLDAPLETEDGDLTVMDMVSSGEELEEDACRRLDRERLESTVWDVVDQLPGDQPAILHMVYQKGMTRIQAGEALGYGNGKVHLEENKALRTLRNTRKGRELRAYYEEHLAVAPVRHRGLQTFLTTWESEVERDVLRRI